MKSTVVIVAALLLTACADQQARQEERDETVQAVQDFIELRGLKEVDKMPTSSQDSWSSIEDHFLVYKARRGTYLVELHRRCYELEDNTRIVPDERMDANYIRARFETIRGCRIHRIFALNEAEAAEIENIGEAPGSRN